MQTHEILGYTPNFSAQTLNVLAFNLDKQKDETFTVPFEDIAREFYPEGEGKTVMIVLGKHHYDEITGPSTEHFEFDLSPADFVSEILENVYDSQLTPGDREPYISSWDSSLLNIISCKS